MIGIRDSLWSLIAGPSVWSLHFLLCYVIAAIFCAKVDERATTLAPVRGWIAAITVVALVLIAWSGMHAFRKWGIGHDVTPPHDRDTVEDRARFLGYATLLLCGISFVGTIYVAMPALFIATCR